MDTFMDTQPYGPPVKPRRRWPRRVGWCLGGFLLLLVPLVLLLSGLADLGPALAASDGHGTPGTFTVTSQQCEQKDCNWLGTFQPNNPMIQGWLGMQIWGNSASGIGAKVAAVDTGDYTYVYPPGGGGAWETSMTEVVAGSVLELAAVGGVIVWPLYRRRRRPRRRMPIRSWLMRRGW